VARCTNNFRNQITPIGMLVQIEAHFPNGMMRYNLRPMEASLQLTWNESVDVKLKKEAR
jgi:hypothetical protein